MFKQVGTNTVPLTPQFASYFSSLPTMKGDRDREAARGQSRIAWLRRLLQEGKFYNPTWATALVNGVVYRVNGGHSSKMLAECNGTFPQNMKALVHEFVCDSIDDLPELFDQFDQAKTTRQEGDRVKAHKAIHPELDDLSMTAIARGMSGIAFYLTGCGEEKAMDVDEKVRLVHSHQDFLVWAEQFISGRHLSRVGIIAAIFATYLRNKSKAEEFWTHVRDESHPDNANPTRKLARFVREALVRKDNENKPQWTGRAQYCKAIHAANAWAEGAPTDLKYHPNTPLPKLKFVVAE